MDRALPKLGETSRLCRRALRARKRIGRGMRRCGRLYKPPEKCSIRYGLQAGPGHRPYPGTGYTMILLIILKRGYSLLNDTTNCMFGLNESGTDRHSFSESNLWIGVTSEGPTQCGIAGTELQQSITMLMVTQPPCPRVDANTAAR